MIFGITQPGAPSKAIDRLSIPGLESLRHITAAMVECAPWEDALADNEQVLARQGSISREALVRIYAHILGVIHNQELQPIQVSHFVHRLGNFQHVGAIERK